MKENAEDYAKRLLMIGYSQEEIEPLILFRESLSHCPFETFQALFQQGAIKRTIKLKKPRNIYTDGEKFYYLSHYHKCYNVIGLFKDL